MRVNAHTPMAARQEKPGDEVLLPRENSELDREPLQLLLGKGRVDADRFGGKEESFYVLVKQIKISFDAKSIIEHTVTPMNNMVIDRNRHQKPISRVAAEKGRIEDVEIF